jgi:hypothetical protein
VANIIEDTRVHSPHHENLKSEIIVRLCISQITIRRQDSHTMRFAISTQTPVASRTEALLFGTGEQ